MSTRIDQPYNPLFRGGKNFQMNACVGDNGGPYELFHYAEGFFEGGHAAIASAEAFTGPVDVLVYPAAFSYRHAIELMLKQMIIMIMRLLDDAGAPKKIHSMAALWAATEALSKKFGHDLIEPAAVARIGELVGYFNEIDPTGQVFRYPEDIKGNRHLTELKLINVEVLRDQMKELQEILKTWYYQADDYRQHMLEERAAWGAEEEDYR